MDEMDLTDRYKPPTSTRACTMIKLKVTFFMRRREVIEALGSLGISCQEVDKAIKNKIIDGEKFTGKGARAYYRAALVADKFGLQFEIVESECFLFSVPAKSQTIQVRTP